MANRKSLPWKLSLGLSALIVSGCATQSVQPPAEPEKFPELPAQGRVSLIPIPLECSPSCSSGLMRARQSSVNMLTVSESPAPSASGLGTVDYALPNSGKLK